MERSVVKMICDRLDKITDEIYELTGRIEKLEAEIKNDAEKGLTYEEA